MQIPRHWVELHSLRWRWAQEAFREYRDELDDNLRTFFPPDQENVSIVLYGPSQCGKSTLLLRLLGVREGAYFDHVQTVLRGGRPLGTSATCVATRYYWSTSSDLWDFTSPGGVTTAMTSAKVEAILAQVRDEVEDGTLIAVDQPQQIGIPTRYRAVLDDRVWPHILDLPGTNPRNKTEQQHAIRVARRHIAAAHVVVLVTASDDMTHLRPDALEHDMPALASWPLQPDRFRIVLTRTISNDSVCRDVADHGVTSAGLRQLLRSQLEASGIPAASRADIIPVALFPLEYGDTWARLKVTHPTVWAAAEPVMTEMLDELRSSLTNADGDQMRLLAAVRAPQIVAGAASSHVEQMRRAHAASLRTVEARRVTRDQMFAWQVGGTQVVKDARTANRTVQSAQKAAETIEVSVEVPRRWRRPKTESDAISLNQEAIKAFVRVVGASWQEWAQLRATRSAIGYRPEAAVGSLESQALESFQRVVPCCRQCHQSPFVRAWRGLRNDRPGEPEHCGERHRNGMPKACADISVHLRQQATQMLERQLTKAEHDYRAAVRANARQHAAYDDADRKLVSAEKTADVRAAAVRRACEERDGAVLHAEALSGRLDEKWVGYVADLKRSLSQSTTAEDQLAISLAVLGAHRDRELLKSFDARENSHAI